MSIKTKLHSKIIQWCLKMLPPKERRVWVLGSLFWFLRPTELPNDDIFKALNNTLKLADEVSGNDAKLSYYIRSVVWHRIVDGHLVELENKTFDLTQLKEECGDADTLKALSKQLVEMVPDWLTYSEKNDMARDIEALVRCSTHLPA